MLIQEISSAFLTRYKRISFQRDLKVQQLNKAEIALMISEAQQDIQKRMDVVIGTSAITLVAEQNAYNCPSNFGKLKFATLGGNPLDIVTDFDILTALAEVGTPVQCAQHILGNTPKILVNPTPEEAGTLNIYYSVDMGYYQPSGATSQNWGGFSGTEFSGKLLLPDKYDRAVNLFMLAQFFDDYELKYRDEILSLKGNQAASSPLRTGYHFGTPLKQGYLSGMSSSGGGSGVVTTGATKIFKALIAQSGTDAPVITNLFQNTLSALPVLARSGAGIFTITLTGEFTLEKTFLHKPNIDIAQVGDEANAELEHTSADVITLRVFDTVNDLTDGFNAIWINIEVEA